MGHHIWDQCVMCMVLHEPYWVTGTRVLNGSSYMGTMCDVHGLTWVIRGHGNKTFKWSILYGDHV